MFYYMCPLKPHTSLPFFVKKKIAPKNPPHPFLSSTKKKLSLKTSHIPALLLEDGKVFVNL
jgi:hypothetical protein